MGWLGAGAIRRWSGACATGVLWLLSWLGFWIRATARAAALSLAGNRQAVEFGRLGAGQTNG